MSRERMVERTERDLQSPERQVRGQPFSVSQESNARAVNRRRLLRAREQVGNMRRRANRSRHRDINSVRIRQDAGSRRAFRRKRELACPIRENALQYPDCTSPRGACSDTFASINVQRSLQSRSTVIPQRKAKRSPGENHLICIQTGTLEGRCAQLPTSLGRGTVTPAPGLPSANPWAFNRLQVLRRPHGPT